MSAVSCAGAGGFTVLAAANIGATLFGQDVIAGRTSTAMSFALSVGLTVGAVFAVLRLVAVKDRPDGVNQTQVLQVSS